MSTMVWKAAALLGVMGVGGVVVMQAQKNLQNSAAVNASIEDDFPPLDLDDDPDEVDTADVPLANSPPAAEPTTPAQTTPPQTGIQLAVNTAQAAESAAAAEKAFPFGAAQAEPAIDEFDPDDDNPFSTAPRTFNTAPAAEMSLDAELDDDESGTAADDPPFGSSYSDFNTAAAARPQPVPEDEQQDPAVETESDADSLSPDPLEAASAGLRPYSVEAQGPVLMATPRDQEDSTEAGNPFEMALPHIEPAEETEALESAAAWSFGAAAEPPRSSVPPDEAADDVDALPTPPSFKSSIPQRLPPGAIDTSLPAVVELDDAGLTSPENPGLPAVLKDFGLSDEELEPEMQPEPELESFEAAPADESFSPSALPDIPKIDRATPAAGEAPFPATGSSIPAHARPAQDGAAAPTKPLSSIPQKQTQNDLLILNGEPAQDEPAQDEPAPAPAPTPVPTPKTPDLVGNGVIDREIAAGPSQPQLTITKQAPSEAVIGQDLEYSILVKNVGRTAAHNVVVEDQIPRGTECTGTSPKCETENKKLIWRLGKIEGGAEQLLRVRVTPTTAGEIGSIATVSFSAEVAARTTIVEPTASVDVSGPAEIVMGESGQFRILLSNSGAADLKGVIIRTILSEGLGHSGGRDLEYEVGDLPRGKTREVSLVLQGAKSGTWEQRTMILHHDRELSTMTTKVNVIESRLTVSRTGPVKRFVGRPATFTNTIRNPSTQPLNHVQVVETLPAGLDLTAVPQNGRWDPARRTITWMIPQLPAGRTVELPTTVVAKEGGTLAGSVTAIDAAGNKAEVATLMEVAGFSSLQVDFVRDGRPVPVGEQASVRFSVKNKGTAPAEQVAAVFELPEEVTFVNASGPSKFERLGNLVTFEPVARVPVGGSLEFDVVFEAAKPTPPDRRIRVSLHSSQLPEDKPLEQEQQLVIFGEEPPVATTSVQQASGTVN